MSKLVLFRAACPFYGDSLSWRGVQKGQGRMKVGNCLDFPSLFRAGEPIRTVFFKENIPWRKGPKRAASIFDLGLEWLEWLALCGGRSYDRRMHSIASQRGRLLSVLPGPADTQRCGTVAIAEHQRVRAFLIVLMLAEIPPPYLSKPRPPGCEVLSS